MARSSEEDSAFQPRNEIPRTESRAQIQARDRAERHRRRNQRAISASPAISHLQETIDPNNSSILVQTPIDNSFYETPRDTENFDQSESEEDLNKSESDKDLNKSESEKQINQSTDDKEPFEKDSITMKLLSLQEKEISNLRKQLEQLQFNYNKREDNKEKVRFGAPLHREQASQPQTLLTWKTGNPSTFKGTGDNDEDPRVWLSQFDSLRGGDEIQLINFAGTYLKRDGLKWFKLKQSSFTSWNEFQEQFLKTFAVTLCDIEGKRKEFYSLAIRGQRQSSVRSYLLDL